MKVKELLKIFENTKFKHLYRKEDGTLGTHAASINGFGGDCYGNFNQETFIFNVHKDGWHKQFVFPSLGKITEDILEMEIIELEEISLASYSNTSSSGTVYIGNNDHMIFKVKK